MRFKSLIRAFLAICITAILAIAVCGCEDLGVYEDTQEYYDSFGEVVLISGSTGEKSEYSVAESFYNEQSRENFLSGDENADKRVAHSDYAYMAIPVKNSIDMDSFALYAQSLNNAIVYINVYIIDDNEWKSIIDQMKKTEDSEATEETTDDSENEYPVTDSLDKVGTVSVNLQNEKWGSFVLDYFEVDSLLQKSIQINCENGVKYILLEIKNNCIFGEGDQPYVDPNTSLELEKVEISFTNLLVRALDVKSGDETKGGN